MERAKEIIALLKTNPQAADRLSQELLREQGDHPELLHLAGVVALECNDLERAQRLISAALDRKPDYGHARANMGLICLQKNDMEAAARHLRMAVQIMPHNAVIWGNLAMALIKLRNEPEAERAARQALALSPSLLSARQVLAQALLAAGKPAEAVTAVREGLASAPKDRTLNLILVDALTKIGAGEEAADRVSVMLREHPGDAQIAALARRILFWTGRSDRPSDAFVGPYATFAEARTVAAGYDGTGIIARRRQLAEKLGRLGASAVAVNNHARRFVAAVRLGLGSIGRQLRVCDVGGALGQHAFACTQLLGRDVELSWTVVETSSTVALGREFIRDPRLRFVDDLRLAADRDYDVVLMSGLLQYVEDAKAMLAQAVALPASAWVIDRLPLIDAAADLWTVQYVNELHEDDCYPSAFFARAKWLEAISQQLSVLATLPDPDDQATVIAIDRKPLYKADHVCLVGKRKGES